MPSTNVNWPPPLTRFPTLWPGQFGVPGTDHDRGERMHCTGEVFYVDPNFPGVSDRRDGTSPLNPLRTVAAALTKVQPQRGDVIVVMGNDYWDYAPGGEGVSTDYILPISEEVTIPYTASGVRIVGASPSGLGVMWQPASNAGICITNYAIDVTIEGFLFTDGDYTGCTGIYSPWNGATLFGENLTVRHCTFDDSVTTGIWLEWSWYNDIHDNVFLCGLYGVYCDPEGSGIAYSRICNNWFMNCGAGLGGAIYVPGASRCKIAHNQIYNIYAQSGAAATNEGICTGDPGTPVIGRYNLVHHNTMSCALPGGGAGDYDDFNEADDAPPNPQTDAWIQNYCMNGPSTTIPA